MRSQLHEVAQWVGPDAAQRLTAYSAHLRATTAPNLPIARLQQPRAARRAWTYVAREDRQEDGLPTVVLTQFIDLVRIRDEVVTPSRSS